MRAAVEHLLQLGHRGAIASVYRERHYGDKHFTAVIAVTDTVAMGVYRGRQHW